MTRLFVAVMLAVLAACTGGCASSMDYKESADGSKREVTESSKCMGLFCTTPGRGAGMYVPLSRYESAYGYGYERNYLDGSRRGACYGVVQGPGPNDRKVRYEPTLERDQFGRPTVWTCAPGRRNSPPDPDGCCSD